MIDPRYTVFNSSINILIDELIEQIEYEEPEKHEIIYKTQYEYKHFSSFYLMDIELEWEDDDDFEQNYKNKNHYDELFGTNKLVDPVNSVKITNGNLDMLLAIAKELIDKDTLYGFGIVITDEKGNFYNPLHPISALNIKQNDFPFQNFTMILYMLEEPIDIYHNLDYHKRITNINKINHHIIEAKDKNLYSNSTQSVIEQINKHRNDEYYSLMQKEFIPEEQPTNLITPIHLADHSGIIYPWYATIESKNKYNSFQSRNIYPLPTENIHDERGLNDINYEEDIQTEKIYNSRNYSTTCIGKYSPRQWTNFKHMNIMQTNSMYNNYIITENWALDVYTAIEASIKILESINEPEQQKEKENE